MLSAYTRCYSLHTCFVACIVVVCSIALTANRNCSGVQLCSACVPSFLSWCTINPSTRQAICYTIMPHCSWLVIQPHTETDVLQLVVHAVECCGKKIHLPMFVDTGGQEACLNKTSWQLLAPGVDVAHWGKANFLGGTVHGFSAKLHLGQDQTQGVNMVRKDWLSEAS